MTVTPRQMTAFTLWQQYYPADSAAAWVGNNSVEVGPNLPTAWRDPGKVALDHGSQYLEQYREARLAKYEAWVAAQFPGAGASDIRAHCGAMKLQIQYGALECKESFPELHTMLLTGGDIAALTTAIMTRFEMPSANPKINRLDLRIKYAEAVFSEGVHISAPTASTKANQTQIAAKGKLRQHNENAGAGVVMGAGVAILHKFMALPNDMTFWAGLLAGGAVLFSLIAAQRAALASVPKPQPKPVPVMPKAAPLVVAAAPLVPAPVLTQADLAAIAKLVSQELAGLEIEHEPAKRAA